MNLLKHLLFTCFFPVVASFYLGSGATVTTEKTDTIVAYSYGVNNKVVLDSILLKDSLNRSILSTVKGEIIQVGHNNSVDITTGDKTPNSKKQVSNKKSITERNKNTSTINITQTGKNNSVKINSR